MTHVRDVGLERANDAEVWRHALALDPMIVTKDSDFNDLSLALGAPPKVVWLRIGNCTRDEAEHHLRRHEGALQSFATDDEAAVFVVR